MDNNIKKLQLQNKAWKYHELDLSDNIYVRKLNYYKMLEIFHEILKFCQEIILSKFILSNFLN